GVGGLVEHVALDTGGVDVGGLGQVGGGDVRVAVVQNPLHLPEVGDAGVLPVVLFVLVGEVQLGEQVDAVHRGLGAIGGGQADPRSTHVARGAALATVHLPTALGGRN